MVRAAVPLETILAKPDARDDAFIREVDDEYRRSQLEGYWSRYGRALAIGVVLLLVALAAGLYWREDRARRAGKVGEEFTQALTQIDAGNAAAAAPLLARLADGDTLGYRALAKLMQAGIAVQGGDVAKGLTLYRAVAADAGLARPYRDLATIKATRLEYDSLQPATVIERLKSFAVPGGPWFAVAAEMIGIAELRLGHRDRAAPLFVAIVRDPTAPPTLRNRAAQLAVSLGTDPAALLPPKPLTAGNAQ